MLYKIIQYGIDGKLYFLLKSMYSKTEACVNVNGFNTAWFSTKTGVMQGDSLSPTLFNLFINDLALFLKDMNVGISINETQIPILMYADDVVILSENEEDLQHMLNLVNNWCQKWKMSINQKKTKAMHFRPKTINQCMTPLFLGQAKIEYTNYYKYLGVYINEFLEFDYHCTTLSEAGTRALGSVISKLRNNEYVMYDTYTKCVECSIYPVVDYGTEIWGYVKDATTDHVQLKAIQAFLGVHKFAPNLGIMGDMGWCPSHIRRKLCMLHYWNRLVKLDDDRITKIAFNEEYSRQGVWCSAIKDLLYEYDCRELYDSRSECDLSLLKEKMLEKYCTEWQEEVACKPKLRTYKRVKDKFGTEEYENLIYQELKGQF